MEKYGNKRLFVDVEEWGGRNRYVRWQLDLLPMIWKNYNLSAMEERIFLLICMQYDNAHESNREPLKLSYTDIAHKVQCSIGGAIKAISNLEYWELITVVGERKGRAKRQYVPNIDHLHEQLKEYLQLS